MGEGYNWHLYGCRLFSAKKHQHALWNRCLGSQLILPICRVNRIQLVNTISLCRIIFCSVLFVVITKMC
jgi:hypothetical protein